MELLLNLVWIALATVLFAALWSGRNRHVEYSKVPYFKAILALSCALVLLFPVVSASDDLHPTQAVLEDASKRTQHLASFLRSGLTQAPSVSLPVLMAMGLFFSLTVIMRRVSIPPVECVLQPARTPISGRAPPRF